jgi:hypothetical protein
VGIDKRSVPLDHVDLVLFHQKAHPLV